MDGVCQLRHESYWYDSLKEDGVHDRTGWRRIVSDAATIKWERLGEEDVYYFILR